MGVFRDSHRDSIKGKPPLTKANDSKFLGIESIFRMKRFNESWLTPQETPCHSQRRLFPDLQLLPPSAIVVLNDPFRQSWLPSIQQRQTHLSTIHLPSKSAGKSRDDKKPTSQSNWCVCRLPTITFSFYFQCNSQINFWHNFDYILA